MDFDLTEDQALIVGVVGQIVARHLGDPTSADYFMTSPGVEAELAGNGFLGGSGDDLLGPAEALLAAAEIGRLPHAIEAASSGLFAATLLRGRPFPRPLALALAPGAGPIRYLADGGSMLLVGETQVRLLAVGEGAVEPVDSLFAYPYGRLRDPDASGGVVLDGVSPDAAKQWWRVGIACEIGASGRKVLETTSEFVKQRRQFGRAIGSFQAVQHRLAHCATLVRGIELLARRAAVTGDPADAALAATMAQHSVSRLYYDCTQFQGAIGLTLENPLHFWTYRLRALQGELRGLSGQAAAAAALLWPGAVAKQESAAG